MSIDSLIGITREELEKAAYELCCGKNPQPMDDLIARNQKAGFNEGYKFAMGVLSKNAPKGVEEDGADPKRVREFLDMALTKAEWSFLPYGFLYDLFNSWNGKAAPQGHAMGRNKFLQTVKEVIGINDGWICCDRVVRAGRWMDSVEPLIYEYGLDQWKEFREKGTGMYRGLLRAEFFPRRRDRNASAVRFDQEAAYTARRRHLQ